VTWFFPSNDDFRVDNPFWNGTEDISSNYQISPLQSLSDLPSFLPRSTLILIPYLEFTPAELVELQNFVIKGGTLVLADDYGHGNQILEYLGLKVRFSGQLLLDPFYCYKNQRFPRITHFIPSSITNGIDNLVLNNATSLIDVNISNILALSSSFSFLDLNGNQEIDEAEPTGPLPVVSNHDLGNGEIILISDPSIFISSMGKMEGNYTLIQTIAANATAELLIDQSHLPSSNLQHTQSLLVSIRNLFTTPAGAVCLVVVALTITMIPVWYKKGRVINTQKGDNIDYGTK
jgi:hypothetical protein